ncbi:MAG: ABC transporter ATP-binding protein [Deltaproteobacteria bacterium]|nr:ABC transporter ATP-binding protein [Deltaproteobacteria bacterium]
MNNDPLLQLMNVASGYGNKVVVRDINLQVSQGEIVTLLGSNGVGKSTILRTITGQIKPKNGRLLYMHHDIAGLPPYRIATMGVGYSPEGRRIFGNLTVYENLVVGAYRLPNKQSFNKNLEWIYSLFPRLKERANQLAETMSGGEQQMLAIGRALISKPRLLLLDEPSLGLAPVVVQLIVKTLEQINQVGVSIFLVEQNASMALKISHYAFVMENGRIVQEGKAVQLLEDEHIADIYLGLK